jgi:BirA family biotin operon repressor/biotin-[acetyl-CoA-carboxylase] ligase
MFHAPELLHRLSGLRLAHPIHLYQQIGSTNDQAKHLAEAGAPEGLLLIAEEQTAGRGRGGRRWLTPPGTTLALSLVLRPALPAALSARLTMLAGLAVSEALEQAAAITAALKWPNDVLINGRKTAGILIETAVQAEQIDYAVLGIGLNVSWAPAPHEVDFPATCVQAEAGREVDRLSLLHTLLTRMEAWYPALADDALFTAWRARLAMLNEPAELRPEAQAEALLGRAVDVAPDGALIFQTDSGETRRVLAGTLHLRARPAP